MASQSELDHTYMNMAIAMSKLSHARRNKVGSVGVTKNGVVLTGVNGLPEQFGNNLEYEGFGLLDLDNEVNNFQEFDKNIHRRVAIDLPEFRLITREETIHAELNVILKGAREGVSLIGSTFYITLSPCVHCASMLVSLGVERVVYLEEYRDPLGISALVHAGITCEQIQMLYN